MLRQITLQVLLICALVLLSSGPMDNAFAGIKFQTSNEPEDNTAITIKIFAQVASVDDREQILNGAININDVVTGTYTYNSMTADSNPLPTVGDYVHTTPPYGITVYGGGFVFQTDPNNVDFLVEIVNDHNIPPRDNYLLRSYHNLPLANGATVDHIAWQLDDETATALSSAALPTVPPNLPAWTSIFGLTLTGCRGPRGCDDPFNPRYFIRAHVTAVQLNTTWHVAANGSDITGTGSEANPFATIQHGIDMTTNGDTVLVHPGVYRENINFNGKNITVGSLFITTANEDYILQTVIDGQRNNHVVTFAGGESAAAQLSGFTITNGYAHSAWPGTNGGGISCSYSNPTLTYLKVSGNEADQEGGGLYFNWCSPVIHEVIVANNLAGTGGGGIRYSYGSVSLENVVVTHNSSRSGGSGIQFYHSEGTLKNALISDNTANNSNAKGGGLQFDGCSPTFINATIVGNLTAGHGGGLNVSYMSEPTLVNSIVWGNTPEQIYYDTDWPGEAITIEYSDIQGGAAGIVTNGHGPVYWGEGNIDSSPRFVNAGLGNYHLANDSPAINAGKVTGAPLTDVEGNPRPNPAGSNPDMGAYENPVGTTTPSLKVYLPITLSGANTDLLVWYDFEDNFVANGNVADRSGNGHTAQVSGAVSNAMGISGGQAIYFPGNGYLQASSNPAAGRTSVTFSLWFKTEHPENNYKLASGAWWNWGPGSGWIMATHIPEFWSDDTQSLYLPGISNNENHFPADEWVHEVVTYDGDRIKEYTNGQLVNDWPTTGAAIGQGRPMVVGAWPPFTAYNFQGSIDDFRIYSRSLTQQEVQALYDQER